MPWRAILLGALVGILATLLLWWGIVSAGRMLVGLF
jgi:hypothetical protein